MELTETITLSEDVVAREVGEETMLLDLASGTYFGLNPVGGRFWQLIEEGRSAAEARDLLLEEFDVSADVLDADLSALLDELAAKGLIAAD
ncbi:MAG TPA: PqqD family protein [Novosphingobium sp.]|nr:PqqD family protein [Novosphingobium sp.]